MKKVVFEGDSLGVIRSFPDKARLRAGFEIDRVQRGLTPLNGKPFSSIGAGVREIRVQVGMQFRVIYVAHYEDTIYVLHAFQKKMQKTPRRDIELARRRLAELMRSRK